MGHWDGYEYIDDAEDYAAQAEADTWWDEHGKEWTSDDEYREWKADQGFDGDPMSNCDGECWDCSYGDCPNAPWNDD